MPPKILVSYDDTANDRDALALGRLLGASGAEIALAYVRHSHEADPAREQQEQDAAEELLRRGALALGAPNARQLVVGHRSTGEGLQYIAEVERSDMVVFGSEYRTPDGRVRAGHSAEHLMTDGKVAVAIAPAGLQRRPDARIEHIRVISDGTDPAPEATAASLAEALGAEVVGLGAGPADLLVVGSRAEAKPGTMNLSMQTLNVVEDARCAILALPRGREVVFVRDPALV